MSSGWGTEIRAMLDKELQTELRNRSSTYTALLLSLVTVFTMAFAFYGRKITAEGASGMLWAALLFAGVGTLMRAFVAEDEQGTGDLLRMWARPHAVYWGKAIFAFGQMLLTAFLVTLLFFVLTGTNVVNLPLLVMLLIGGSAGLAGLVTLVSALISRGNNRSTLGGVVALPIMVPLIALGVLAGRSAIEVTLSTQSAWMGCFGVWAYSVAITAVAPYLFAAIWREQ